MNRDIVLGSSIVVGAFVLAAAVVFHDSSRVRSLELQREIVCAVDSITARQSAQEKQTRQTLAQQQNIVAQVLAQQTWERQTQELAAATERAAFNQQNDFSFTNNESEGADDQNAATVDDQPVATAGSEQFDN